MKKYLIETIKKSKPFFNLISTLYNLSMYFRIKGLFYNNVEYKGAFLRKTRIKLYGKNNTVKISPENRLTKCMIYVKGNNCEIIVDKHCNLSNVELWIEDNGGKINIGYRTTMVGGHIAATEGKSINIGEDCMFSHRIEIRNGDSHSIFNTTNQRINYANDVIIGNHVWLGADVKVLKGVTILDGSIVATGSIVSNNVDSNSIFAGIPAKKIKENIHWKRERL